MNSNYLFRFMHHLFGGFLVSALYCALTGTIVWLIHPQQFQDYVVAYISSFNCLISAGLIIGTGSFVIDTKRNITKLIESSFTQDDLDNTAYKKYREQYFSLAGTLGFSGCYVVVAFFIFYFCKFPFDGWPELFLIGIACTEYALGVYVGRKLYFIAHMLDSITSIRISKHIFRKGQFNNILSYVNILSTLTIIFVYIHVKSFYDAPFEFSSPLGAGAQANITSSRLDCSSCDSSL